MDFRDTPTQCYDVMSHLQSWNDNTVDNDIVLVI